MQEVQQSQAAETPQPSQAKDLGFGSRQYGKHIRLVKADGSANVMKLGRGRWRPYDLYQTLISISWLRFTMLVFLGYFYVNLFFSVVYYAIGIDQLAGIEGATPFMQFLDGFFFSAQTITTLGYGRIAPVGTSASVIAAIESMVGLMSLAIVTGLLYGRFSRASARLKFSSHAVIGPYEDHTAFMFRIANERSSHLIDVEAVVTLVFSEPGQPMREFHRLTLEVDQITFLATSWTIVHPITKESPLYGLSVEDIQTRQGEFIILIKAFDDSFGANVQQRKSYIGSEIHWGEKFTPILGANEKAMTIDLARLDETKRMPMPGE